MRTTIRQFVPLVALVLGFMLVTGEARANYAAAKQFFDRKDYVQAASAFFNAFSAPQNREEKLKAEWGLGQSLQQLGLYYSASMYYSRIVVRGPQGGKNPFFRNAMEELGKINSRISLGQSHVVQLFRDNIRAGDVPRAARGFYFYYLGIEAFSKKKLEKAEEHFEKVPTDSAYNLGAIFHLGVIANLSGRHSLAVRNFEKVLARTRNDDGMREIYESALMNLARVNYETKRFVASVKYYGEVPRDSDYWLDAIWEASWAFFFMQKFNNSLGNIHTIHSPFFINRFYPESYILQAITFLRLCRYEQVKESMHRFKVRYEPVFADVKSMLNRYDKDYAGFFRLVYDYRSGNLKKYENAEQVLKKLSLVDSYKEARDTIRFSDRELDALGSYKGRWGSSGLLDTLEKFLKDKKGIAVRDAGRRLWEFASTFYAQLLELSSQTKMIVAEMQLGKIDVLRSKIGVNSQKQRVEFIGGMQELNIRQELEYWPFEQEYWEDELGYYVYNLESQCAGRSEKEKEKENPE